MEHWQEAFEEAFTRDEDDIQRFLNDCDSDKLCAYISDNPIVFHEVCKAGFYGVASTLLMHGIDVNVEWAGMTALQLAASSGDLDLVKFLLSNDAEVSRDVWTEASPFYLASLHGHYDVVRELTKHFPSYVKEPESRSSLFYAACKGGNLAVVQFWYLPGMDVNTPVQLISSFENCENMVPLYAACEGNQLDVAKFLVDSNAVITSSICKNFPEMTAQLVEGCFHQDTNEMYIARLNGLQLGLISPLWFEQYKTHLTTLDLSDNKLKTIPSIIPWGLVSLQNLYLSNNRLQVLDGPGDEAGVCDSLEKIDLSNNQLEEVCADIFALPSLISLDLSSNKLQYLIRPSHAQPELNWPGLSRQRNISSGSSDREWNLPCLTHLLVRSNSLLKMPEELRTCHSLIHLDASDNELYSFISPWNCPLHYLDLSDNLLERFPVSVEEFWSGSLVALYLRNNNLEELGESIVKLSELKSLDVSNNKIECIPESSVWDCHYLEALNLSNNNLGVAQSEEEINKMILKSPRTMKNFILNQRRRSQDPDLVKILEFPSKLLSMCLKYLYLKNNNLDQIPLSVCRLQNLCLLDISQNPLITTLPRELGLLTNCRDLVLSGTSIKDPGVPERLLADSMTSELLEHLRQLLRKCEPNNRLKLVVMGPQDKGKSTLLSLLQGISGSSYQHGNKIRTTEWKLTARNAYQLLLPTSKPDILFNVWELPGHPDLNIIHGCFLTQNTLYLVVFDLRKDILHLQSWLCQIQANTPKASVILVGTFFDKLDPLSRDMKLKEMGKDIFKSFSNQRVKDSYPCIKYFKPVSCATKEGVSELKKIIYDCGVSMANITCSAETFVGRKTPQSYRLLVEKVKKMRTALMKLGQPPVLSEEGFQSLLEELPDNEIIALDDVSNALRYLLEVGCLLHFNEQLTGLNSLYFLDPVWLQELMALIAFSDSSQVLASAKVPVAELQKRFDNKNFPGHLFPQFMQLLKRFEIAVEVDNGRSMLVPSKLPKEKPVIASSISEKKQSRRIYRLYKLTYIPPGLWSRFIIRLLKATERFSQTPWFLNTDNAAKRQSGELFRMSSSRGLAIQNKDITYWGEGVRVAYESSYFLVESVNYRIPDCHDLGIGILITIESRKQHGLSAMGVIVDELDDILRDYFPSFQDLVDDIPGVYAVCPHCFDQVKDESGIVVHVDHFDVQTCALTVLNRGDISCAKGIKIPLEDVVPEMFFKELPKRFFLDSSRVIVSDLSLGQGAAGAVFPGKFGETDVAIKMFHCTVTKQSYSGPDSVDSGSASMSTQSSQDTPLYGNMASMQSFVDEANSLKAYKAFSEVRKEVAVLSKLRHPCIVSFLGLSVHPHLYIVMELAKLGSLRSVLDKEMKTRTFNKFVDKHKAYSPVFSKDLTFKIVYQVAKGLQYLHEHSITYRDLKSDNILVCSLDISDDPNVKLSDYGISKFSTTQGLSGFVGTPGYMAPEILNRQTYTEKVDIFSFSMLIYEIVCGHAAFEEYQNLMQIIQAAVKERKRPSLMDFNIVSHFPYMEHLMSVCWNHDASQRPSAEDISKYMRHPQFVCQQEVLSPPESGAVFSDVTCTTVIVEDDRDNSKKHQVWVWEASEEYFDRRYSIYNLDTSSFHVQRYSCPGANVRCMLKVDKYMWVGTEANEIEVFGCHSVGVPQCKEKLTLAAIPTVMVFHKLSDSEEEHMGHVFVGLDNGTVAIYSHQPNMRKLLKTWKLVKTLTLSDLSVSGIALVSKERELWVACGHVVIIVSTQTLLKEDSIDLKDHCVSKKLGRNPQIQQLVCDGSLVWCSFRSSSKILEYDAELRQVMYCLDIRDDELVCKYVGKATETNENDEDDSELQTDTDNECGNTRDMGKSTPSMAPPVIIYDRQENNTDQERHYLTLIGDEPKYEEPVGIGCVSDEEGDQAIYEPVVIGRQISSDSVTKPNADNSEKRKIARSSNRLNGKKVTGRINTEEIAPTPPPRPPKLKTSRNENTPPAGYAPPVPPRHPRITVTSAADTNDTDSSASNEWVPPLPPKPVTIGSSKRSNLTAHEEANKFTRFPVQSPSSKDTSKSSRFSHYDNNSWGRPQSETDDIKPPVPPRRSTMATSADEPKRAPVRPKPVTIGHTSLPGDPPAIPPRTRSMLYESKKQKTSLQTSHTSHTDADQQQSSAHGQKSNKKLVSSMLVVRDTLWVGTSKGNIVVIGLKESIQRDYPRPKLSVMKSISGAKLDKSSSKDGPLYMMSMAGNLVVSCVQVCTNLDKTETQLAAWEAMGSERLVTVGQFWQSLRRKEKELSQKNSFEMNI